MISHFWNFCRACPALEADKVISIRVLKGVPTFHDIHSSISGHELTIIKKIVCNYATDQRSILPQCQMDFCSHKKCFKRPVSVLQVQNKRCHRKWQFVIMKNGYTKNFFSDPKSAVLTQPKDKSGIFSKGHDGIKIVPIVFKYIHHK